MSFSKGYLKNKHHCLQQNMTSKNNMKDLGPSLEHLFLEQNKNFCLFLFASISIPIKDNHAFVVSWGFCRPRGVVPAVVVSADLKEWFVPLCFLVTQRSGSKYTHFGFREWRLWFLNLLLSKTNLKFKH